MSEFPLFGLLKSESEKIPDLTPSQEEKILKEAKKLSRTEKESFYLLVKFHSLQYTHRGLLELPYSGKAIEGKEDSGVEFDMTDFPMKLKKILYLFVTKRKKD